MAINQLEAEQIANRIIPIFNQVIDVYDYRKYPAQELQQFKESFSSLRIENYHIRDALIWKWGHWGKPNFPQHHRELITKVEQLWTSFIESGCGVSSNQTFAWWQEKLASRTRYITVAYITHLVHHREPLPIIDQHNFRAKNSLINHLRPGIRSKKKPSNWNDIAELKSFMTLVCNAMEGKTFSELDRFLMMYGRNYAAR